MNEPQYEVGKLYNPDRRIWTPGADFNYRKRESGTDGTMELRLFYAGLTWQEIRAVNSGIIHYSYAYLNGISFFLYSFDHGLIHGDCSFTYHLIPEEDRAELPELGTTSLGEIFVILIEAKTGIIQAMRLSKLSVNFSLRIYNALLQQKQEPFDSEDHNRRISHVYSIWHSYEIMYTNSLVTCVVESRDKQN